MALIGLNHLCPPAYFYLVISTFALLIMFFQNIGNANLYCLGSYSCGVTNTYLIFVIKVVYIVFWTWLLNIICRSGYTEVSWFLVLIPFILMFLAIALIFVYSTSTGEFVDRYNPYYYFQSSNNYHDYKYL